VVTGAVYRLFVSIYDDLKGQGEERAVEQASSILGVFATHVDDYTPEDWMTLEDVAKGYLKVDAELFGGRYRDRLVGEFTRREIFDASSLDEWLAHEAGLPDLRLPYGRGRQAAVALVRSNLDRLGIGPDFGLTVQSLTRDGRLRRTIVRVQLTQGRGAAAVPLDNHGVLVFREDGSLAEYQAPLPADGAVQVAAAVLLDEARKIGLDTHGAPLSIVRQADGTQRVEAHVLRGDGPTTWVDAFTPDAPDGERREVPATRWANDRQAEQLQRAGIVLDADALAR
jgi:hypothetical protein